MKKLSDIKISARLNFIVGGIVFIAILALGVYNYTSRKNALLENTDEQMHAEVNDLKEIIYIDLRNAHKRLKVSGNLVHNKFVNSDFEIDAVQSYSANVINQITKNQHNITMEQWEINGEPIHNNFNFVDDVQRQTDATATVFQKTDLGYVRISTNVRKNNGERAVGTFIPMSSPVVQTIERGNVYEGRAFVVNDWYLTYYEPIYNNNQVVGMLYVGVLEKDLAEIRRFYLSKTYYETGYPYIVNSEGELLVHPDTTIKGIAETEPFQQIINDADKQGKSRYKWEGKWKYQYYDYIEEIDAYVVATFFEDQFLADLKEIRNATIISIILVLAVILLVLTSITNAIKMALNKAINFSQQIANGNLSVNLDVDQKDEIGDLAYSLNSMISKLREVVAGVLEGARGVASASEQLSMTAQQLSQSNSEQASNVEEVSSTMEEIASSIDNNKDNAQETEKIAGHTLQNIQAGNASTSKAVNAMREIADKTSIIGDIAFQTNLLALNAAVEAARAGEHGKGFAVVAAEVRKLAERSRVAADEINKVSVESIKIADGAGAQLQKTVPDMEKTTNLVNEISASSLEQSNGATQVNNAIQQLNDITQQNAASSEEMATSAEELSSQSEQLTELISFFRLEESASGDKKFKFIAKVKDPTNVEDTDRY